LPASKISPSIRYLQNSGRENGFRVAQAPICLWSAGFPDHRKHAVIVLAAGATRRRVAEIGMELARSELGRRKREACIVLAVVVTTRAPASADLGLGSDRQIGTGLGALRGFGIDVTRIETALIASRRSRCRSW
jgi:hypothetical protein